MTDFDLPGTESTSAALRRVEAELAAVLSANAFLEGGLNTALDQRDLARAELASAQTELEAVRTVRDSLDRQRAEAIAALASELIAGTRGGMWVVARDGGRDCLRCGQEIRRGEAYEYMPSTDQLQHIHCRDRD